MKPPPSFVIAVCQIINCSILLAALSGCSTSRPVYMGGATEYLKTPETPQTPETTNRTREAIAKRSETNEHEARRSRAARAVTKSSEKQGSKKVESEIGDASEIKIDDATRQRMNPGSETKSADNADKPKKKKVESEIRDASDLQIDEQTKQKMDNPK